MIHSNKTKTKIIANKIINHSRIYLPDHKETTTIFWIIRFKNLNKKINSRKSMLLKIALFKRRRMIQKLTKTTIINTKNKTIRISLRMFHYKKRKNNLILLIN